MDRVKLSIDGMRCGGCVKRVAGVRQGTPGVTVEAVEVGTALVSVDAARATADSVAAALERAGYRVQVEAAP